jgi:hypothetical protein
MTSPGATGSPSCLSQRARLPSVMVGDSTGIRILIGIVVLLVLMFMGVALIA